MKSIIIALVLSVSVCFQLSCTQKSKRILPDANPKTGEVFVVQVGTTENETYFNVLRGKQAQLTYTVEFTGDPTGETEVYKTISHPQTLLWAVDKIHVRDLKPDTLYSLHVYDNRYKRTVERRQFQTFNLDRKNIQFIAASCMSDHHRFQHVRSKIWKMIFQQKPDFLLLLGDNVYVDDLDLVQPSKMSPQDIWLR